MDVGTLSLGGALSPITRVRRLFTAGEVGVWYDRSDFNGLYQDSSGTTAVTAAGQTVGLMLDKSKGQELGPELVTNGTFDTSTGWALTNATISGGTLNLSPSATASIGATLTAGLLYKVTYTITANSPGSSGIRVYVGSTGVGVLRTTTGTFTEYTTCSGALNIYLFTGSGFVSGSVDNLSVKLVSGYHATQSTSTARGLSGTNLVDLDGVDDGLTIPAGGGGSTGFFLCTAVRVDGGAGTNRVIYSDAGTNTGYIVRLNASNQLELAAGNGTAYTLSPTTATLTAGPYVVTAWDDGTNLNVQVNGDAVDSVARPVVSAGNADFRIGKDYGAATGYFNGAIYSYVYVKNGQNVDDAARAAVKKYVAGNAGVSI